MTILCVRGQGVQHGRIRIYVYDERGHRHHRPHCHVYWPDGACVFDLHHERLLSGVAPPPEMWDLLRADWDDLQRAWTLLNRENTTT